MKKSKSKKNLRSTKYFKWGLTAFLVIAASICFIFFMYNADRVSAIIHNAINVMTPIIDGFVIAYLLNPIMRFFEVNVFEGICIRNNWQITPKKKKVFRVISIILTFIIVFVLLYAFFGTVLPQIYSSIESIIIHFPTYYNNIYKSVDSYIENSNLIAAGNIMELIENYSGDIVGFINNSILPSAKDILKSLSSGVFNVLGALLNLIIGFIVAIYLLIGKEKYVGLVKKIIYSLLPKEKANNMMVDLRFVDKTFGGFLVGKLVDSLIIGILCFVGLNILHTPYAVLVSVIVGITNIIPFFGPYLGAIPSALLILIVDPKQCLYFLIFVIILQQVDGNIIGPAILGNSIGISSFWIIVAITVFGGYFGIFGMIVGVPIFACVYAFARRRINNRLMQKNLPIGSINDYANAKYIDNNNKIVEIDRYKTGKERKSVEKSSPQYKRYIELNPSEIYANDKKEKRTIKEFINMIKDSCSKLGKKVIAKTSNDEPVDKNANESINNTEAALDNGDSDINKAEE